MAGENQIDPTGNAARLSTNLTVDRQTPKSDFGDLIQNGLANAVGSVANGLSMAAPLVPGGAIISAAVSSLNTMPQRTLTASYAATGVTPVGGAPINTTVPTTGSSGVGSVGAPPLPSTGVPSFMPSSLGSAGVPGGMMGLMNTSLTDTASDLGSMLQVQIQIQRENQVFTTVSNVLKTRHDTVKNTISNVH